MHHTLNAVMLPFIGEVNLTGSILAVFFLCLLAVVAFEFVNGFHDYRECRSHGNIYKGHEAYGSCAMVWCVLTFWVCSWAA